MPKKNFMPEAEIDNLVKKYPVAIKEKIQEKIHSEMEQWNKSVKRWLDKENPFYEEQTKFKVANRSLKGKNASIVDIVGDYSDFQFLCKKTKYSIDEKFWISEIDKLKNKHSDEEDRLICRTLGAKSH